MLKPRRNALKVAEMGRKRSIVSGFRAIFPRNTYRDKELPFCHEHDTYNHFSGKDLRRILSIKINHLFRKQVPIRNMGQPAGTEEKMESATMYNNENFDVLADLDASTALT